VTFSSFAPRAWALAAILAAPALIHAQQPAQAPNACDIDESKPKQIAFAALSIAKAAGAPAPAARQAAIKDAFKQLYDDPAKINNPAARSFQMGEAVILWLQDAGTAEVVKRGDLGIPENPTATVDLLAFADSQFTVVETAKPACAQQVIVWRSQAAWFRNVQAAFAALGADDLTKAETLARRTMVINHTSAYGPYVVSNVAQRRLAAATDAEKGPIADTAFKYLGLAVKMAGKDTSYADIKRRSMLDIGRLKNDAFDAAVAKGDMKAACAGAGADAAAGYQAYLSEASATSDAYAARSALASLYVTCSDTAKAEAVYDDVLKNTAKYGDIEATQAGVTMVRIGRGAKATALFEAALAVNGNQRDALNNLTASYFAAKEFKKMLPIVDRLVVIDPNNPDNWLWYAYAYQGLGQPLTAKDPKKTVYGDSLVYFNNISESMPVKVTFTQFSRGDAETKISGMLEYRQLDKPIGAAAPAKGAKGKGAKAAPAPAPASAVPEKSFTLKFTYLDKAGAVIAETEVPVGPVKMGESKEFSTTLKKPGVISFKYAKVE
jgi:tetratricopeptide (TPR) repeat protein